VDSDPFYGAVIQIRFERVPADLTSFIQRIGDPQAHTLRQGSGSGPLIILAMHLLAAFQQPIDILDTPATGVNPLDRAASLAFIQLKHLFGRFNQGAQGFVQLGFAIKQPIPTTISSYQVPIT
jgi:hypothetical protein